ncbi:MAG: HD-GYP domain-containing protein [Pseudobdellovibrionaceae bacterium]
MFSAEKDRDMVPIQSLDIEAETKLGFNLYVNLPLNQKYVLYRKAGGSIDSDRLEKLSRANVSNFFILKEDYHEFVKYVALRIRALIGSEDSAQNRRLMMNSTKSLLQSTLDQRDPALVNSLMQNLNDIAVIVIESVLETSLPHHKRTFRKLLELAAKGTDFQKHPVNVASLAILLTFGIGYSNEKILSDMAMSALLHDIGLSRCPPKLVTLAHQVKRLTFEEREQLYSHPRVTLDILDERGIRLSHMARTIILQHHEEFNGYGYPEGFRGYNLNELAQVLRIADDLDGLIHEITPDAPSAKIKVAELLDNYHREKVIEPSLLGRVRAVLV